MGSQEGKFTLCCMGLGSSFVCVVAMLLNKDRAIVAFVSSDINKLQFFNRFRISFLVNYLIYNDSVISYIKCNVTIHVCNIITCCRNVDM